MARHTLHRDRSDSPQRKAKLAAMADKVIAPPPGIVLRGKLEKELWATYCKARVYDDWRDHDLVSLYKVVKLEVQIRAENKLLDQEGYVVASPQGTKANPRLSVVRTLTSLQLTLTRALNLSTLAEAPTTVAKQAKQAKEITEPESTPVLGVTNLLDGRDNATRQ